MFVFCNDCTLESIVQEQYFLSRKANISFQDSNMMPDFERQLIVGMLLRDLKEEEEFYKNIGKT